MRGRGVCTSLFGRATRGRGVRTSFFGSRRLRASPLLALDLAGRATLIAVQGRLGLQSRAAVRYWRHSVTAPAAAAAPSARRTGLTHNAVQLWAPTASTMSPASP